MQLLTVIKLKINKEDKWLYRLPYLLAQIKDDFKNYGRDMTEFRKKIEDWTEFVNPYARIKSSVECLLQELEELNLQPEDEAIPSADSVAQVNVQQWSEIAAKYSKGLGICFGTCHLDSAIAREQLQFRHSGHSPMLRWRTRQLPQSARQIPVRSRSFLLKFLTFCITPLLQTPQVMLGGYSAGVALLLAPFHESRRRARVLGLARACR